jgi:hypothetical protein
MAHWQKTLTRSPKTKAQLRDMLAEAVRNTQPETKQESKIKKIADREPAVAVGVTPLCG